MPPTFGAGGLRGRRGTAGVTAASVMDAGVCFKLTQVFQARIGWQTALRALAVLVMVSSVGFVTTGVLAKLFRVRELDSYLAKLRF